MKVFLTIYTLLIAGLVNLYAQCDGCYLTVSQSRSCADGSLELTASTNGTFQGWTEESGGTASVINPANTITRVTPEVTTTYFATATNFFPNLITNGDFEDFRDGFTSDYSHEPNSFNQGDFAVVSDPGELASFLLNKPDHTGNNGLMLVLDGSTDSSMAFYKTTVNVEAGISYNFTAFAANIHQDFLDSSLNPDTLSRPVIVVTINGDTILTQKLSADTSWNKLSTTWTAGQTGAVNLFMYDTVTTVEQNDFVMDDISLKAGEDTTITKSITVEPCNEADVFSPNDDGQKDTYFIPETGTAKIYNLNRDLVRTLQVPAKWDGRDEQGNMAQPGYYAVIINGEEIKHVTIVR